MTSDAPEQGALLLTGASGTVGTALLRALAPVWPGELVALGRTCPWPRAAPTRRFVPADLGDPAAVARVGRRLAKGPPIGALVCAAGMDARASLHGIDIQAAATCAQVNCWAHLQLLDAATQTRRQPGASAGPLPTVLVSSDVIGDAQPATLIYAAAKAAAEEAFRHAAADTAPPGIAVLILRLPDIGVPMRAATPGPPPPPRTGRPPHLALAAAAATTAAFVTSAHLPTVEVWHA
ncbi:SDR family NAD(P)-dependent oxidoreductase [Actinomadura sp. 9N407]|uniref:SDR family NAD(P)-dependent oxidoreductase n=1 Tax=Actinomadura sp. 9N407 TaxID=3375154 RepID=UPI0037B37FAA